MFKLKNLCKAPILRVRWRYGGRKYLHICS